ncbi:uncharacterized protein LOC116119106 [Pistacia vera]|uniref:uncharacterized protein LOC116119106 n=1 Tax=Pistacia vera TaxID=55513 RepID=UPI001263D0AF|nr:uncharacterized protein LOC116119106 [Pistacia vera]
MVEFLVVDCPTTYNINLGRLILDDLSAVTSVHCQAMRFLTPGGVATIRSCRKESQKCYNWAINVSLKWPLPRTMVITESESHPRPLKDTINPRIHREEPAVGPTEELREICVSEEDPTRILKVGSSLNKGMTDNLVSFLKKNLDMFAWVHVDMLGISPKVMCHRLNINPKAWSIRQKRSMDAECSKAHKDEVDKLLNINFIREVKYPEWLANLILVTKSNGKWWTCIDFTNLNKVCPKDSFSLPQINQLVDAMIGNVLLNFMDAYSGYNQIPMYQPDKEHTSFITDHRIYCYKIMSFGLKNVKATY